MIQFLPALFGIGKSFVDDWRDNRKEKREIKKAVNQHRMKQAADANKYTREWELRALEQSDNLLKRISFFIILWPLVWVHVDPEQVSQVFATLDALPDWYKATVGLILAGVWGLSEFKTMRAGQ